MAKKPSKSPLVQLNVLVPESMLETLEEILDEQRAAEPWLVISQSSLVRDALTDYIKRYRRKHPKG